MKSEGFKFRMYRKANHAKKAQNQDDEAVGGGNLLVLVVEEDDEGEDDDDVDGVGAFLVVLLSPL